jgi:UDP-N-acetylmuramoyl-tripeptide--D-alanyl-D-alanine ligase
MLELGEDAAAQHAEVGVHAAGIGIDVVVTVGHPAESIAEGARRTAGWDGEVVVTAGRERAGDWLRDNVGARDVVLVKASRGAALEHLADALVGDTADQSARQTEGGTPSR